MSVKDIKTAQFVVMRSNGIDWWRVVRLALETSPSVAGKQNHVLLQAHVNKTIFLSVRFKCQLFFGSSLKYYFLHTLILSPFKGVKVATMHRL